MGGADWSMQIRKGVVGGHLKKIFSFSHINYCLMVIPKPVVVCIYVWIFLVLRVLSSLQRGSDGVDRLVCCLTLSCSSPLSPICLGNHTPRCREKGREGGSEENPAD